MGSYQQAPRLVKIGERIRKPAELLRKIGMFMLARYRGAFRLQSGGGIAWPERRVPNMVGAILDLSAGQRPKVRRLEPRPALIDRGTLRQTLDWRPRGQRAVEVGSNLKYANIHNRGGELPPVRIDNRIRMVAASYLNFRPYDPSNPVTSGHHVGGAILTKAKGGKITRKVQYESDPNGAMARLLTKIAFGKEDEFGGGVPRRPFVFWTSEEEEGVRDIVARHIAGRPGKPAGRQ